MKFLSLNPLRTLLNRLWIPLSYIPFLNRFILFLRAKTQLYLMSGVSNLVSTLGTRETLQSVEKSVNFYLKHLSRKYRDVMCNRCGELIPSRKFEKHVSEQHGSTAACVWCEQISGTREENLDSIQLKPIESSLFAQTKDLLEPSPKPSPPLFPDENLNLAAAYLLLFVDPQETHAWYHVTVTTVAYVSFVQALNEDEGHTNMLDFSCWCDAGPYWETAHRQHRHMIVVSPADHFEQHVWPKVTTFDAPNASYSCKSLERIESPMQLVSTIGSLSGPESTCETGAWQSGNQYHFRIDKRLPVNYKLPLTLLWDGGLEQLLYDWKFKNVDLSRVMQSPVSFVDGQWKQKIKDFYDLKRNIVVPVSKNLKPTRERGQESPLYTFHLLEGKKVYFYYSQEMGWLIEEEWMQEQADGGNCFFQNVGEAMWTMDPSDQEKLSCLMSQAEGTEKSAKESDAGNRLEKEMTKMGIDSSKDEKN